MHEWIKRQNQLRGGKITPGLRRGLPYLRLRVHSLGGVDLARNHQQVAVRERGARRIPPAVIHVRKPGPGVGGRRIGVSVRQTNVVGDVSAGYEQAAVGQKCMARTENVCSYVWSRRECVCRWIPELRVIRLGPEHNLTGWEYVSMDSLIRPRHHRRPLPDCSTALRESRDVCEKPTRDDWKCDSQSSSSMERA